MKSLDIIIPVYNDPEGIKDTITSIDKARRDSDNVLIIDNGSTDRTPTVIQNLIGDKDNMELYFEHDLQGSYAARNTGIQLAEGDLIAFLDADETVEESYFESAIGAMEDQNVDYLGCNVELTLSERTLVGRYNVRTGFPVEQYLRREHYAPTCALFVRRDVFTDVGRFDARLISGGDREFGERVHNAGYSQGYTEAATVYHPARTGVAALAKKNIRVGRGFCQKQRYHADRYGTPGIPPRPHGDSSNDDAAEEALSLVVCAAFISLSLAMLACRGIGYYYEFVFGDERGTPQPTESS